MNNSTSYELHQAIARCDLGAVQALLANDANPNQPLPVVMKSRVPLHVCVMSYSHYLHALKPKEAKTQASICEALLTAGAQITLRDADGVLPSAAADTMPRVLRNALYGRAWDDVGVFDPDPIDEADVTWLCGPVPMNPLSGEPDPEALLNARVIARRERDRRSNLERHRSSSAQRRASVKRGPVTKEAV